MRSLADDLLGAQTCEAFMSRIDTLERESSLGRHCDGEKAVRGVVPQTSLLGVRKFQLVMRSSYRLLQSLDGTRYHDAGEASDDKQRQSRKGDVLKCAVHRRHGDGGRCLDQRRETRRGRPLKRHHLR